MGTTSEELKKLYTKLGGKDPKVAGFSAPGEILNAINEIPLPTEYELPTVTTEDAGDVLVVNEEGHWDKGEAGSGVIPNPEGEATVDLTKLGIDDTVYGIPKDTVVVEVDDQYYFKDPNMTVETLFQLCKIKNVVIHYASSVNDSIEYYLPYGTSRLWRDSATYLIFSRYTYSDKFYENPTTHDQNFLYGNITTGGSQKKLLHVQQTNPLLPKPSSGDSGKTLVVDSNNKWSIAEPSKDVVVIEVTKENNHYVIPYSFSELKELVKSKEVIIPLKIYFSSTYVEYLLRPMCVTSDDQILFSGTNVATWNPFTLMYKILIFRNSNYGELVESNMVSAT